ncbi:uncharacterized protein LOC131334019 isoform X1 [Rhododendron vialii]|uniref:uncharacterized protein LOC131334019 isoform X1 n=1 Tax=Rhododendron vialii TaxID=182163 RepID=UPI00265EA683|nr:uncharacterized protein LOC131334019 isoform X1 [Rhododendron vialii]
MGMIELKDMVRELNLFGSMTYHYKVPARDLYHGFRNLEDDSDCVEMVRWIKLSKTIEVYVEHHEIFSNENHHLTTGVAVEEHLTTGVADEEQDRNGDRDVYEGDEDQDYTNSSDDKTDLEDLVDSEADDDEDDRLFDIHVDRNVEWGGLSMGKGKEPMTISSTQANDNEESDIEAQSDELISLNGSDGEEGREEPIVFNPTSDMANPKFKVGMIFSTRKLFKAAVKEHAIKTAKAIKFVKNDSKRVRAACKKPCPWSLLASKMQGLDSFQVRTYIYTHNCKRIFHNRQVTSTWLSNKYVETLRSNPSWQVKCMKDQVQKDHKVGVSRSQLYRAKSKAKEMIEGSHVEQYAKLPDYCEELRRTNPGSTVIMKTIEDEEGGEKSRFERLYIALGACKEGFMAGCRPFIGLDGCHLKGPYKGQLLVAVGIDGNNQTYAVAYAVVEAENKASWKWFLEILSEDLNIYNNPNFTFISDKQKGLIAACGEVTPYAEHRFCIRHFYNNFKEFHKGLHLKELLFSAAKASYVAQFNFHMEELNAADEGAVNWLADHPPMHWSRSHFKTMSKCDVLDNNRCESFNDTILDARSKTIIPMLEEIRLILMERMQKRREKMREYTGVLCPNIRCRLNKRSDYASANCLAYWSGERIYQVHCFSGEQVTVDLTDHTCTCRKWDLTGFPCAHAIAAIEYNHENVDEYVDHWFTKQTCMASYEPIIYPMNGADMWPKTGVIGPLPPNVKIQSGRPKKLRKRGPDEPQIDTKLKRRNTTTTCAQCGNLGHNKRTCKGQPVTENQGTTRAKLLCIQVRKKHTTANGQQQNASQPTMGTSGSQPTMWTSFSQPQAAMGTNRPFNMRAPQATKAGNIRAPPQATHGVNIRAPPQPNHGVNTRANQRKFINYSGLPKASTKGA